MTWVTWFVLTAVSLVLVRSLWSGLGPPWQWHRPLVRRIKFARERRRARNLPDPFAMLEVQHRLSALAAELAILEAANADLAFYARAHRIHTRRSAYDQLLSEACTLAGVPTQRTVRAGERVCSEDERFHQELELAARGWSW